MFDVFQGQNCSHSKKRSLNGKFPLNPVLYCPTVYWPAQMKHRPFTADLPQKLEEIILLCSFQLLIANTSAPLPTECSPVPDGIRPDVSHMGTIRQ